MAANKGEIKVKVLEDGRVVVETGDMAGPIHTVADEFLLELQGLLGDDVETKRLKPDHVHVHDHLHAGGGHSHGSGGFHKH